MQIVGGGVGLVRGENTFSARVRMYLGHQWTFLHTFKEVRLHSRVVSFHVEGAAAKNCAGRDGGT